MDFALETLLCCISLLGSDHFDKTKTARVLGVRVAHDVALFNLAILFKEARDFLFGERGVNACYKEVGARVTAVVILVARSWGWATASQISDDASTQCKDRTYRLSRPLGEALRAREASTSRRSARGDLLRSRS